MGYNTFFDGSFKFTTPISPDLVKMVNDFQEDCDNYLMEYNYCSSACQWKVSEDGTILEWDFEEKFYYFQEWLHIINNKFFQPTGNTFSGTINWQEETPKDRGVIVARIIDGKTIIINEQVSNLRAFNKSMKKLKELYFTKEIEWMIRFNPDYDFKKGFPFFTKNKLKRIESNLRKRKAIRERLT